MSENHEEITLDSYAASQKKSEGKSNSDKPRRGRLNKKFSGNKKTGGTTNNRRTGNNDNNRTGGKPRQNVNHTNNKSNRNPRIRETSNNPRETVVYKAPKAETVRTIPEHLKRIVKVYNLLPSINSEEFYNLFVKYGTIEQSNIETDKKGKSEERGFIVYRDNAAAKRAIEDLNGVELEGRIITVEFMKDGEKLEGSRRESASHRSETGVLHKRIHKEERFVRTDNNKGDRDNGRKGGNRSRHNDNRGSHIKRSTR